MSANRGPHNWRCRVSDWVGDVDSSEVVCFVCCLFDRCLRWIGNFLLISFSYVNTHTGAHNTHNQEIWQGCRKRLIWRNEEGQDEIERLWQINEKHKERKKLSLCQDEQVEPERTKEGWEKQKGWAEEEERRRENCKRIMFRVSGRSVILQHLW